ncbi:MAG: S49 family peptidase, partial [Myxococcota bacterium]
FTHTAMSKEHREALTSLVDDLQQTLLEHISARRQVTLDVTRDWVATGPHLGGAAMTAGLVDRLAYWDEVLAEAEKVAGRDDPLLELDAYSKSGELHDEGPTVALIYGDGQVIRGESSGGGSPTMGSDSVTEAFRDARKEEVEGVLFRVDSPGGSYVASDVIRREVEVTRDAGIPVVVSMGNVAASGGYFVAMDADRIVAQTGTITGSIGVFVGSVSLRRFWEHWLGITFDDYQSAPHAAFFSSLDPPSDETKARIGTFLDRVYDDFVTKAAAGRGMPREELETLARGRVWSGRAAKANGLIDEVGGMEKSLDLLKEVMGVDADQDVTLEIFPKPKTTFELIGEQFGAAIRMVRLIEKGHRLVLQLTSGGGVLSLPAEPRLQ